jgi:hypothetical protein
MGAFFVPMMWMEARGSKNARCESELAIFQVKDLYEYPDERPAHYAGRAAPAF